MIWRIRSALYSGTSHLLHVNPRERKKIEIFAPCPAKSIFPDGLVFREKQSASGNMVAEAYGSVVKNLDVDREAESFLELQRKLHFVFQGVCGSAGLIGQKNGRVDIPKVILMKERSVQICKNDVFPGEKKIPELSLDFFAIHAFPAPAPLHSIHWP